MKRIVALVSLLLCMTLVLASCSLTAVSFKKFYKDYEYEAPHTYTSATQISELNELLYETYTSYLVKFRTYDGENFKFYNAKTGAVTLTLSTEDTSATMFDVFGIPFIKSVKTEYDANYVSTTHVSIYDANGMLLTEAKNPDSTSVTVAADFFMFDNVLFQVNEDGTTTKRSDNPLAYLPGGIADVKTENYYYAAEDDEVSVYDEDFNCVFYWEVPFENYAESSIYLLSDGVLLAQVMEILPEDAKKYDFVMEGYKINLISYILKAKKDKVKEVDLDFVIEEVEPYTGAIYSYVEDSFADFLPKKVSNIAYVYYINDHKIDSRETEVTIKNNGKAVEIAPEFDYVPEDIAEGRWIDYRYNGEEYLIDEKGDIIGNVTAADDYNEKFVRVGDKLLNYDLELVYDAKANGKQIVRMLNTSVILRDETPDSDGDYNYYLYRADGTTTSITDYYNTGSYNRYYYVTYNNSSSTYTFYSESGSVMISIEATTINVEIDNVAGMDIMLIRATDEDGKYHYYKFS